MKRILVSILCILYMAGAMGATVHMHYCMGQLAGTTLTDHGDEDHACSKCGMKKAAQKNGCCKDEHKVLKTADHQSAKTQLMAVLGAAAVLPATYHCYEAPYIAASYKAPQALPNAPPGEWRSCPIYILVCNFRI